MNEFIELVNKLMDELNREVERVNCELSIVTIAHRSPQSPEPDARIDLIIRPKAL